MKTEIKNWSVLGKGIENTLNEDSYLPTYTYITKRFTGTEKEFYLFCANLYDTIDCWKEIESGETKSKEQILKELKKAHTEFKKTAKVKSKYKVKSRYKAPSFEDSFKQDKKPFRLIG